MNNISVIAFLALTSLAFSNGAMAERIAKSEYKTVEKNIVSEYKSAKKNCTSFADNAKDVCMAEAKGKKNVAIAELDARYKPGKKASYKVSVAKATAEYSVAKAQLKSSKAFIIADEEYSVAHKNAQVQGKEASSGCCI